VLYGVGDLRIEEHPMPVVGEHEVLVEVRSVGVCGSDVHYYEHARIGSFVVDKPLVLGHEAAGVVVATGSAASRHQIGDRVALEPGVPCRRCPHCQAGRYNVCPDVKFFATPPIDGAFAKYVTIDEDFAYLLPDHVSFDAGAMLEPLSVGIWANRKAGTSLGDQVLVTGAGPIGILAALVAKASGAGHVTIVDVNADRLRVAADLGVDETINSSGGLGAIGEGFDVLLECTGVPPVVTAGINAVTGGGHAVLVGMSAAAEQSIPVATIQSREINLTGTFRYANTYPTAVAFASSGQINLDAIVGARFPLGQAEQALKMGHTDPSVVKTVVAVSE
jgi:L-iditol 2-dehydrogenase